MVPEDSPHPKLPPESRTELLGQLPSQPSWELRLQSPFPASNLSTESERGRAGQLQETVGTNTHLYRRGRWMLPSCILSLNPHEGP